MLYNIAGNTFLVKAKPSHKRASSEVERKRVRFEKQKHPSELTKSHLEMLDEALGLTVDLLEREKSGTGPDSEGSLDRRLIERKETMLQSIKFLKCNAKMTEDRMMKLGEMEELVERFDVSSLRKAQRFIEAII
jgi:hypothetical protein